MRRRRVRMRMRIVAAANANGTEALRRRHTAPRPLVAVVGRRHGRLVRLVPGLSDVSLRRVRRVRRVGGLRGRGANGRV